MYVKKSNSDFIISIFSTSYRTVLYGGCTVTTYMYMYVSMYFCVGCGVVCEDD